MSLRVNILLLTFASITGCAAGNSKVTTTISPIDGRSQTVIQAPDFSTSYIYPADGIGSGIKIEGGSVVDKEIATIVFTGFSGDGLRNAMFKADGQVINAKPVGVVNDYEVSSYGVSATRSFLLSCEELKQIANAKSTYLRINYLNGFVDYTVTKAGAYGADGIEMIRKIASYCE